ncbi:MAG: cell division protein SepF, partial [Mycobacterium sp.]
MSTLHKVKAYFGMAPMEDYDDDYYDDEDASSRGYSSSSSSSSSNRPDRFGEDVFDRAAGRAESRYEDRDFDEAQGGYRGGFEEESRYRGREFDRPREFERSRFASLRG